MQNKSLQILFRDAHAAVTSEVQAALLHGGYGDILPGHYKVLRHLGDEGARPAELAAHANVTRQAITKAVDELEQLGLVRRDPDPTDGRGVIVRYTDRGLAGLELARQRMLELETEYAKRIGTTRWNDTRAALETLFDDQPAM
jgi:DNA-binding MarR family transcriptional regulator